MQNYGKKIIEEIINWAVPVICAGTLVMWNNIPQDIQHYWPVAFVSIIGIHSLTISYQNRKEIKRLREYHERADAKEAERKSVDDSFLKAFRAMLDDDMGNLYMVCLNKGYTTEDERRRYNRLHIAYEGAGGNGEAKRRKVHFDAIMDEEEWKARQNKIEKG